MTKLLLCGAFAAITVVAAAQSKDIQIPNYGKVPYWIEMIKNPNVNYYEAVTAYEEFWKSRKNPLEENPCARMRRKPEHLKNKRATIKKNRSCI